jgi:hypothetical protein
MNSRNAQTVVNCVVNSSSIALSNTTGRQANGEFQLVTRHEGPERESERESVCADVELYSFFNRGARWERVAKATPRPLYPFSRHPEPTVQRAGWAGIRSQDRPDRIK